MYGENHRKVKWKLPLTLCRNLDEIDVDFALNYVFFERQKFLADKNYNLFSDQFFSDDQVESDYGSISNPILIPSISFTYNYLEKLMRLNNDKLIYERVGNKYIKEEGIILDRYKVKNVETDASVEIVVNPYADFYYSATPKLPF